MGSNGSHRPPYCASRNAQYDECSRRLPLASPSSVLILLLLAAAIQSPSQVEGAGPVDELRRGPRVARISGRRANPLLLLTSYSPQPVAGQRDQSTATTINNDNSKLEQTQVIIDGSREPLNTASKLTVNSEMEAERAPLKRAKRLTINEVNQLDDDGSRLLDYQPLRHAASATSRQVDGDSALQISGASTSSDDYVNNRDNLTTRRSAEKLKNDTILNTVSSSNQETSSVQNEDMMKFPLYMRILATLACLIIFTVGVCGNLLVPLVVIKTKYLRNSTNLFLINLSIADLLVLIVCMPIVLIELHSRPETWLLGEPMCKLSNFVEMLAANGSIFTILAISFERYYAICKPLKAGYKCTRLRATIIIGLIWLLSTILTSPILIMAKSRETVFMDGSPVYNCLLETDTYWPKMYVFVSMIAFFCLPLIVLMLVYWLIGRRLIRENLAMSTTTSLATSDSIADSRANSLSVTTTSTSIQRKVDGSLRRRKGTKGPLLESISAFFASLHHNKYHQFCLSGNQTQRRPKGEDKIRSQAHLCMRQPAPNCYEAQEGSCDASNRTGQCVLSCSEALSSENSLIARNMASNYEKTTDHSASVGQADGVHEHGHVFNDQLEGEGQLQLQPSDDIRPDGGNDPISTQVSAGTNHNSNDRKDRLPIKRSLANQFVYHLFHIKTPTSQATRNTNASAEANGGGGKRNHNLFSAGGICANGFVLHPIKEPSMHNPRHNTNGSCHTTGSDLSNDDQAASSHEPFLAMNKGDKGTTIGPIGQRTSSIEGYRRRQSDRSRFSWAKRFSVSSSSASMQTSCTILPSEVPSFGTSHRNGSVMGSQPSPKPIIHYGSSMKDELHRNSRKKNAHFSAVTTGLNGSSLTAGSSSSNSDSSSYTSKSPSPDPLFGQHQQHGLRGAGHIGGSVRGTRSQCMITSTKDPAFSIAEGDDELPDHNFNTRPKLAKFATTDNCDNEPISTHMDVKMENPNGAIKSKPLIRKGRSLDKARDSDLSHHSHFHPFSFKRANTRSGSQSIVCGHYQHGPQSTDLLVVQDLSKKQQMDSRRQVVIMLAFVVACFFLLFFPYRVFTIWLILSTEDQVQSLGMETYYNLTYFSRILIYLHSAINPIAYNLISTKFRRAFMSILLCRGSSTRRHFTTEHRIINNKVINNELKKPLTHVTSN